MASLTLNPIAMVAAFSHLFFNIFGIALIYPIKILRDIPIKLALYMADQSVKNKFIPLIYLGILFVALPLSIIFIGG